MIVLIGTLNYFQEGKNEVLPAEHEYESEQNNQNIEKGSIIEEEKNISSEENKSQEQAVELDITENSETEELSPKNTQNDINVPEYKIRQPKTVGINSVKTNAHKKTKHQ